MFPKIKLLILLLLVLSGCSPAEKKKRAIFVSILPQKYFVERIVANDFEVYTLVRPGHSPATYEPLPQQMTKLGEGELFFRIGVPFENSWLKKIAASNPDLKIIDTRKGIQLREIEDAKVISAEPVHHDNHEAEHEHEADPHIWLSPELVKKQAHTIFETVTELNPQRSEFYLKNLQDFIRDLTELQSEFYQTFSEIEETKFLVFHPVWGYLADEFNLQQIPIELGGKKPSAKELTNIIEFAKTENIKVIFVQKQFSTQEAEAVAQAIQGKIVQIDPLAENYLENMRVILSIFKEQLK
jgi:zinc transport system substrate-binding protein